MAGERETTTTTVQEIGDLRPVFVVGNPRSGTTLVQQILTAHKEFWTAPETRLLSRVLPQFPGWRTRSLRPDEVPVALSTLEKRSSIVFSDVARARLLAWAEAGTLYPAHVIVETMFAAKPADSDATRWLEKTPAHVHDLPLIWRMFPDATVINVVRDPRDSSSSRRRFTSRADGLSKQLAAKRLAEQWLSSVASFEAHRDDPRMLLVRYEDIVTDPDQALAKMAAHVGITPDPTALSRFGEEFTKVTNQYDRELRALNSVTTIVDRRGVWKNRMTPQEAAIIELLCGETMQRYDYIPDTAPQPELLRRLNSRIALRRLRKRVSKNVRRAARKLSGRTTQRRSV
jgi:hypothetical protein